MNWIKCSDAMPNKSIPVIGFGKNHCGKGRRVRVDWVRAQLAMVEAGAAKLEEVMLPYLIVGPDTTLYRQFSQNNFKALPPPKGDSK